MDEIEIVLIISICALAISMISLLIDFFIGFQTIKLSKKSVEPLLNLSLDVQKANIGFNIIHIIIANNGLENITVNKLTLLPYSFNPKDGIPSTSNKLILDLLNDKNVAIEIDKTAFPFKLNAQDNENFFYIKKTIESHELLFLFLEYHAKENRKYFFSKKSTSFNSLKKSFLLQA
jgi:hypothetical protein